MRLSRRIVLLFLVAFVAYAVVLVLIQNVIRVELSGDSSYGYVFRSPVKHVLCVLIPHRNRVSDVLDFIPHIHSFLVNQSVSHRLLILNQGDGYRFNRAMLLNVGFLETRGVGSASASASASASECDYIAMHDADLLPVSSKLSYEYRGDGVVYHVASPELHPLYHYAKYVGGILLVTANDYQRLNGMSNVFWGWGREDDEFYLRMKESNLRIERPDARWFVNETAFVHVHDGKINPRDQRWLFNQRNLTRRRDRLTGLHNTEYEITRRHVGVLDGATFEFLNIMLHCDKQLTPYCSDK